MPIIIIIIIMTIIIIVIIVISLIKCLLGGEKILLTVIQENWSFNLFVLEVSFS